MARQAKDQDLIVHRFIGIDPGEQYCGWARCYVTVTHFRLVMGTFSVMNYAFHDLVDELIPYDPSCMVAVEEYRARPVGHQAFNEGRTTQLIGALRYKTAIAHDGNYFLTVPAMNPSVGLREYGMMKLSRDWTTSLIQPTSPKWEHARSALRVVCANIAKHHHMLLKELLDAYAAQPHALVIEGASGQFDGDVYSSAIKLARFA